MFLRRVKLKSTIVQDKLKMEVIKYKIKAAIKEGDFAKIQTLVSKSKYNFADPDLDNSKLLSSALRNEHPDIAKWLLEQGCPVNSKSYEGPLFVAIQKFYNDLVLLILKRGARPHFAFFNYFCIKPNALHLAVKIRNFEAVEHILSLANPKIVDILNCKNQTALQLAVSKNCLPICQLLLKFISNLTAGKNKDVYSSDKSTSLRIAIFDRADIRIIEALLNAGVNVNELIPFKDYTLLDFVLSRNYNQKYHLSVAKLLLMHNAKLLNHTDFYKYLAKNREFVEYITLLRCMKKFLNPYFFNVVYQLEYFDERKKSCLLEIKKMRQTKIIHGVSYYDLLIKPVKNLAIYGRNKNFIENFKSKLDKLEEEFPIYSNKLTDQFNMAKYRARLLNYSHSIFNKLLPYTVCKIIFAYLDTKDLKNISLIKFPFCIRPPSHLRPPKTFSNFL